MNEVTNICENCTHKKFCRYIDDMKTFYEGLPENVPECVENINVKCTYYSSGPLIGDMFSRADPSYMQTYVDKTIG